MGAVVSVAIFGPPDARYGVESIAVRSACAEASLPSIVRRFARGGLPTSIWWTEDLSTSPLLPSLARMARQFVYDSRCWRDVAAGVQAVTALSADAGTDLADLNWRRLKPLRDLLKHAAAANGRAIRPNQVRIGYARQERALAVLLAGWLASRLEWPIDAPIETGEADGDEILTLAVRDGAFALKGTLDDRRARVEASGSAPLVVAAAPEPEADAVAAELRLLACERDLLDTLRALARRIASGAQL
jgi:glucose-6-phosphate dehydrogenase assembly protein OpcA